MEAGQVQLLVILGNNPVFTAPADVKFGERLAKVALVVYHSLYQDETSELAHWNIPDTHPLETWGDPRAYDGTVTLMQPLIAPLYDAHSAHEVLATLTSATAAEDARHRQGLLDARVRRRHGMGRPQRRWRDVRQCRRLLEAGRARRLHSRHGDDERRSGNAVQAGSGCRGSGTGTSRSGCARRSGGACAGAGATAGIPVKDQAPEPVKTAPPPAAPAAPPAVAPPAPVDCRTRAGVPTRSDGLGRPLRQQRLAAGSAEAADEADVGHRRVDQSGARRREEASITATSSSCATAA